MKRFNCRHGLAALVAVLALLLGASSVAEAQTTLAPGDVAVVGFDADGAPNKSVTLVTFVNLAAGTSISFTDNGYFSSTMLFRTGEGAMEYILPAALPAGSVITVDFSGTGVPNFSSSGDQLFVYQGTITTGALTGTLLFGVNDDGAGIWQADATSANTSALPPALVGHEIALPELDNYAYTGITSGTRAELYAAIRNAANWTGNDALPYPVRPTMFTILADSLDGGVPPADGGPADVDAGPADVDMGPAPVDMGPAPVDMGPTPVDMGPTPVDMGPTPVDMGPADVDAGSPDVDMGTTDTDAGTTDTDGGTTDTDGGGMDIDAGMTTGDMGTPGADLGAVDAGTTPPAPRDTGACTCSTPGSTRGDGAAWALLALASLLPLARRRRHS